jgi:hypothetical protein
VKPRSAIEGCEPEMQFRRLEMADRELIAAILTAGMLPTMEIPQSRAQGKGRLLTKAEAMPYNAPSTMPSAFIDSS